MIQILEIWANDAETEFAAKISGYRFFLKVTNPDAKYTHVIYAAPYLESDVKGVSKQIEEVLERKSREQEQGEKQQYEVGDGL